LGPWGARSETRKKNGTRAVSKIRSEGGLIAIKGYIMGKINSTLLKVRGQRKREKKQKVATGSKDQP